MSQPYVEQVWVCPCGFEGIDEDFESVLVYAGSYYEPPEYTGHCPECGRNWEETVEKEYDDED